MVRHPVPLLVAVMLVLGFARVASAQAPKAGDYYEDPANLGFKVKMPADWDFVPGTPSDPHVIGSYRARSDKGVLFTSTNTYWPYEAWLIKFDRRDAKQEGAKPADDRSTKLMQPAKKDILEWLQAGGVGIRGWDKATERKDVEFNDVAATEYIFKRMDDGVEVAVYACVFKLTPDADVAVVFNGPGEKKKWTKFESAARSMAKTFKLIQTTSVAKEATGGAGGTYREVKRRELEEKRAANPGWELYESPNYFIFTNVDDKDFIKELTERLEAIRGVYEELYPPAMAEEMRRAAEIARQKAGAPENEEKPGEKDLGPTVARPADPMEMSKASVVRVCQNRDQYMQYGGSPSSAGYWNWPEEELVLYDDQASGGRSDTWAVINHEAFHQYVFYFFGNISPHSWYNEGNGDFFSGYEYKNKKFTLKKFDWRDQLAKTLIREERFEPLEELVRFDQKTYYGSGNSKKAGENYAQGWSFIYFLRTGEKRAKGWNPAWNSILRAYLQTLVETDDLGAAVEKAFAGVDWEEMTKCWSDYISKI